MPDKRKRPKKPFELPTGDEYSENAKNLPYIRHRTDIMEDPKKRKKAGELLYQLCKDMFKPKVQSNLHDTFLRFQSPHEVYNNIHL